MMQVPVYTSMDELFQSLDFHPSRIVVSKNLLEAVQKQVVNVVTAGNAPITLRSHPSIPENLVILFGADGSFAVMQLEETYEVGS